MLSVCKCCLRNVQILNGIADAFEHENVTVARTAVTAAYDSLPE